MVFLMTFIWQKKKKKVISSARVAFNFEEGKTKPSAEGKRCLALIVSVPCELINGFNKLVFNWVSTLNWRYCHHASV